MALCVLPSSITISALVKDAFHIGIAEICLVMPALCTDLPQEFPCLIPSRSNFSNVLVEDLKRQRFQFLKVEAHSVAHHVLLENVVNLKRTEFPRSTLFRTIEPRQNGIESVHHLIMGLWQPLEWRGHLERRVMPSS